MLAFRDVTDLRRAGHELERQMQRVRLAEFEATRERDRLNLILENVADPILVTDDQSNIIMMNDEAERLFQVREGGKRNYGAIQAIRGNDTKSRRSSPSSPLAPRFRVGRA